MNLVVTLMGPKGSAWQKELKTALKKFDGYHFDFNHDLAEAGQMVFVDGNQTDWSSELSSIDRKGKAIFLVIPEDEDQLSVTAMQGISSALQNGWVDDILISPIRPLEVLSKIRLFQQILMWNEVETLNTSFHDLIDKFKDDIRLAERIQKASLPVRFPQIKGFQIKSRYLAGLKAGGDYLDMGEVMNGKSFSMILTDSSSYGLSSAVLSVLMRVAMKLSSHEANSASATVRKIYDEILIALGERERLSMFYGLISKSDLTLTYLNAGSTMAFLAHSGGEFQPLETQAQAISKGNKWTLQTEAKIALQPQDRLILLSDGFVEAVGGANPVNDLLNQFRKKSDPVDTLNELTFKVKAKFENPEEDLPSQDCTAAVIDVDSNILRLAN